MTRTLLIWILLSTPLMIQAQHIQDLHEGWQFRESDSTEWLSAQVPGSVHMDLYRNHVIPDPFYGTNEDSVQWIEERDWDYRLAFSADAETLNKEHIMLVFDGLDTWAEVVLNGETILHAENMHLAYPVDVKRLLKEQNELLIHFTSAVKKGKELAKDIPFRMPSDERIYSRKAQYQFGWDWGPRFVGCGIWKDVRLEAWDDARILDLQVFQDSLSDEIAEMHAILGWDFPILPIGHVEEFQVNIYVNDHLVNNQRVIASSEPTPCPDLYFSIDDPIRWWPNVNLSNSSIGIPVDTSVTTLKIPYRYTVKAELLKGDSVISSAEQMIGLRTIELVLEPDAQGTSFYFRVNGVPVFAKGANFIPTHSFPEQTTKAEYKAMLEEIKAANVNMLRIWGGGIYEDDHFYDLCDSLGIMVWQDFMFACAMYPGDDDFLNNVSKEIDFQVRRLRNHPSIVLWCGNNEIDEAWHNWGWQILYGYLQLEADKIWGWYTDLFHELIPQSLETLDPGRSYWPSSPSIGWGRKESLTLGDMHYWGVWWGKEPFSVWKDKTGHFMSEYGFQGMPSWFTLQETMDSSQLKLLSPSMKTHQKHPVGYETIDEYMQRDFPVPDNLEDYWYVSQLLQAWGIQQAFDAHLSAMPVCMGTLFWQWNDCWPVTSWSAVDHAGRRKALYYAARRTFGPNHIAAIPRKKTLDIYLISDSSEVQDMTGSLMFIDSTGYITFHSVYHGLKDSFHAPGQQSVQLASIPWDSLAGQTMLEFELSIPGWVVTYSTVYFIRPPNEASLKPAAITQQYDPLRQTIYLDTDVPAWGVYLYSDEGELKLSDNFFDMRPGYQRAIELEVVPDGFTGEVKIRTLNDLMNK